MPDNAKKDISRVLTDGNSSFRGVRWEKEDKIHITLKFIGGIEDKAVKDVLDRVKYIASKTPPLKVKFSHIDAFPDFRRPRVLVLRLENNKEFQDLNSILEDELSSLGIKKEERKFIPHITIGRINKNFRAMDKTPELRINDFIIRDIGLIKSELRKEGSEYINLGVYKLS